MLLRGEASQPCVQEEDNHQEWCPVLDRRAALRLLGITTIAKITGCGTAKTTTSAAAVTATASTTGKTASSTTAD
jgi:hypothetical protein